MPFYPLNLRLSVFPDDDQSVDCTISPVRSTDQNLPICTRNENICQGERDSKVATSY